MRLDFMTIKNENKKILLIESDQVLSQSLIRMLNKEDYNLVFHKNLEKAICDLKTKHFDTIIFGLNQPFTNSIDSLNHLQSLSGIPEIIVLSSFNLDEIKSAFQSRLINNILIKPIKKETLLDCISNIKTFA
ncbi:MAG: response regulator [Calditrichaeota bacterium]|nr:MAG: response regulator [Calditrichota bacterium]MBL1204981.1 response regulator [Calditrichota bacterium]NOG44811.1 response regulator [Calditrichota bacterium]